MAVKDPGFKYHRAMAGMMYDRGFMELFRHHVVAASDCQEWCRCSGCAEYRMNERRQREAGKNNG